MHSLYKFLIPLFALALLIGCSPSSDTPPVDNTSSPPAEDQGGSPVTFDGQLLTGKQIVVLETSKGNITLELDADKAPKTVTNFVSLAKAGFYNGLSFHRVIPNFMIQGGDPNGDGTGGTSVFGETFEDEQSDLQLVRGVIAMANRGPNTNGSQFFIIQAPATPWLQGRHTVFGRVTEGLEIVDAIAAVERDPNDKPVEPVTYDVDVRD